MKVKIQTMLGVGGPDYTLEAEIKNGERLCLGNEQWMMAMKRELNLRDLGGIGNGIVIADER